MGIVVYSLLLWVLQDLYHQLYPVVVEGLLSMFSTTGFYFAEADQELEQKGP